MSRAFLIVLDSVGCGGAPDADRFFNNHHPDLKANTWGHIAKACAAGYAEDGRSGPLNVPNLAALGLWQAVEAASGLKLGPRPELTGRWAAATEVSPGKDTPSGHWELAGVPVPWDWHYFPDEVPAFPQELTAKVCELAGTEGILGNCHASGVPIIEKLGEEHMKTGKPICYTSADSVFQIAAHEESFGLDRLQKLCADLAPTLHAMRVGRVIARPFVGKPGSFERTRNRHDYAMLPPSETICDAVHKAGGAVRAIGKIGDIFSMRGIDDNKKGTDQALMAHLIEAARDMPDGSLTFANFIDFDTLYGHRRDVAGYARALEWFDAELPKVFAQARDGDLFVFTADHGNDPCWYGTDHTRERVPVLMKGVGTGGQGIIGFADVGASVAAHLGLDWRGAGRSVL